MQLPDRVYDILKWVVMIVIPALTTAYVGLAAIWGFPYAEEIAKTSAVICTLLGALLGISTAQYNKAEGKHEEQQVAQGMRFLFRLLFCRLFGRVFVLVHARSLLCSGSARKDSRMTAAACWSTISLTLAKPSP